MPTRDHKRKQATQPAKHAKAGKSPQQNRPRHWLRAAAAALISSLVFHFVMSRYTRFFSSTPALASSRSVRDALDPYKGTLLAPLLRSRVPGTPGAQAAQDHIAGHLRAAGWSVEFQRFTAETPTGPLPMANIVSRRAAAADEPRLTLAAHYDSKASPEGFVGAIDSAFPCALLLWLAGLPDPAREFDLIFFDGEEAFGDWSDDDSLYGARALAEHQQAAGTLPSTLVLLDLLGNESRFPIASWFPETKSLHAELERLNPRLVGGRPLHQYAGMMQDDHIPYLQRGVPVLHLIPAAFPPEWHTLNDNADLLDWPTMEAWADMFHKWLYLPSQ